MSSLTRLSSPGWALNQVVERNEMVEFGESDVRDGLLLRSVGTGDKYRVCPYNSIDGSWEIVKVLDSSLRVVVSAACIVSGVRDGKWLVIGYVDADSKGTAKRSIPDRSGDGRDLAPSTHRSGRRFDGAVVRCDARRASGLVSWDEKRGAYRVSWQDDGGCVTVIWYSERELEEEFQDPRTRIVTEAQAAELLSKPRSIRFEFTSPLLHPQHDRLVLESSRRAVDEAVRALRGQPFATAIQAVLVAACGEGPNACVIPGPNNIDRIIAACRAWEDCRGRVAPGQRTLRPEQVKACDDAAGLWPEGSGAVYERARVL